MKKFFAIAAVFTAAGVALAQGPPEQKTYDGAGGPIPDVGEARFEIFVPDHGTIVDIKQVCIDMEHTWVGDLKITIEKKGTGVLTTLLDRPGVPATFFGNSSDLNGVYCFQEGAALFPEVGGSGVVPAGTYGLDPAGSYDGFPGLDKYGLWSLHIIDHAAGDVGTLFAWSITMNNIPEPSSLALLALGALSFIRRR